MRRRLLAFSLLILGGIGPGLAHHQEKPLLRWKEFGYKFTSKTIDKCMLRANSALAQNKFTTDMNNGENKKGTYGYVYGWSKDLKTTALIICDYDDKESTLLFSHYGKSLDKVNHLFNNLAEGNW